MIFDFTGRHQTLSSACAISAMRSSADSRPQLMRDFGSMQSPMNAYMLNLGLESLHVRMQRHCANGMAVAQFLENH
ncbi:MAG: PLP-dependent transferase, partial [Faecalibacterium prausnitzii]|nr:PLP-dependent transferase [Faecalibacterium prausnitzii]